MPSAKAKNIDDSNMDRLRLFVRKTEELSKRRMFSQGLPRVHARIKFNPKTGITAETEFPDEEDFRSALMDLRVFYMQNEPIHFYRVCDILNQILCDAKLVERLKPVKDKLTGRLKRVRDQYGDSLGKYPMGVDFKRKGKDEGLTGKQLIDLYFYGKYFHVKNEKKRRELEEWESSTAQAIHKGVLITAMNNIALSIFQLQDIVSEVLKLVAV